MRNQWLGGGALAAGLLVFLGLVFSAGPSSAPPAHAQTCESDEEHCIIITKNADEEGEFSFNDGDIELGGGESEALNVELDGSLTVTEDEADGWVLDEIDCDDDEWTEVDEGDASVTFDFSDFDEEDDPLTIECVFTNVEDEEETATPTATSTTTSTATATSTTSAGTSNTPVVPTPIAPTPQPPTSQVQSGTISPPSTGSGGLK